MNPKPRISSFLPGLALLLSTLAISRPSFAQTPSIAPDDKVTQVSVINALMLGHYDGVMPLKDVLALGDIGVGTVDHLDGELVILDGRAYQIRADGTVEPLGPAQTTPFVTVKHFRPDGERPIPAMASLAALDQWVDQAVGARNAFLAVRVEGEFQSLTMRSVRRQEPPYRPLAEAAKDQSVWRRQNVRGTLVGFRCPDWTAGLNVPGFHWHFLSHDHDIGGHVLDCRFDSAQLRFDTSRDWDVRLPATPDFDAAKLSRDLRGELDAVERARSPEPAGPPAGQPPR